MAYLKKNKKDPNAKRKRFCDQRRSERKDGWLPADGRALLHLLCKEIKSFVYDPATGVEFEKLTREQCQAQNGEDMTLLAIPVSVEIIDKYIPDELCQLGSPSTNVDELKFDHNNMDESTSITGTMEGGLIIGIINSGCKKIIPLNIDNNNKKEY